MEWVSLVARTTTYFNKNGYKKCENSCKNLVKKFFKEINQIELQVNLNYNRFTKEIL